MIDVPVLAWTVASFLGAAFALLGAREAWHDLRALDGVRNGRIINARRDFRNQSVRFLIQSAWVVLGIPALLDERILQWTPGLVVLVLTNVAFAVLAALDLRDRRRLMARVA